MNDFLVFTPAHYILWAAGTLLYIVLYILLIVLKEMD